MKQLVLDTETTGFEAKNGDRILEVAVVSLEGRRVGETIFHRYVNPERDVPAESTKVHGLTRKRLKNEPVFAEIAEELHCCLRGSEILIHNASFDQAFLDAEFDRCRLPPLTTIATISDTLAMARRIYPGKRNSLDALCQRLNVDNSAREIHGANLDAHLLANVYLRMTRGQNSLIVDEIVPIEHTKFQTTENVDLPILHATDAEMQAHQQIVHKLGEEAD